MKCSDVINQLSDYLDAEAAQELCAALEAHFAECAHCRVQIDTVRKTPAAMRTRCQNGMPVCFDERRPVP